MPKFVLAPGTTPLDHLTPEKISDLISQLTGLQEKSKKDNYSYDEKWAIYHRLTAFDDENGWAIEKKQRDEYISYFEGSPKSILIPANQVEQFVVEMENLRKMVPDITKNEFAFRFYIGESGGEYSAVCVPMYGQKPVHGVPSSREDEKEKSFYDLKKVPFFSLLFTHGQGAGFCKVLKTCADAIVNIDKSRKQVAYFTEDIFTAFYNEVKGGCENMRLEFARVTKGGNISMVLSYLDNTGKEIECSTYFNGRHLEGIFFDQGDLIPPPPSDNIIRDSFFNR